MSTNGQARGRCIVIDIQGDGATLAEAMRLFASAVLATQTAPSVEPPAALIEAPSRHISGLRGAKRPSPRIQTGLKRIADGSLESRLLELAAGPVTLKDLVAGGNARKPDVTKAVKTLVASGRLKKSGASRSTRYQAR